MTTLMMRRLGGALLALALGAMVAERTITFADGSSIIGTDFVADQYEAVEQARPTGEPEPLPRRQAQPGEMVLPGQLEQEALARAPLE